TADYLTERLVCAFNDRDAIAGRLSVATEKLARLAACSASIAAEVIAGATPPKSDPVDEVQRFINRLTIALSTRLAATERARRDLHDVQSERDRLFEDATAEQSRLQSVVAQRDTDIRWAEARAETAEQQVAVLDH